MKQNLKNYWLAPIQNNPTSPTLISRVCSHFGITEKELKSKSRLAERVEARRIIAYHLYNSGSKLTYNRIGFMLGKKNHSDAIYLVKKAQDFMDIDDKYKELVMSFK